jgi:hypothetical protein
MFKMQSKSMMLSIYSLCLMRVHPLVRPQNACFAVAYPSQDELFFTDAHSHEQVASRQNASNEIK